MQHKRFRRTAQQLGFAIVAAAMLCPVQSQAAPVNATAADIGQMIAKTLATTTSFHVVLDSHTTGAGAATDSSILHASEFFVRRGAGFLMYATIKVHGMTMNMVDTGKHLCQRKGDSGPWNCNYPSSFAASYLTSLDMVKAFKSSGTVMRGISPAGTRSVQGQTCQGYNFTAVTSALHLIGHGVFWFSSATGRLVEMTEISSMGAIEGTPAISSTFTVVYSQWNDPSIKMPSVPVA